MSNFPHTRKLQRAGGHVLGSRRTAFDPPCGSSSFILLMFQKRASFRWVQRPANVSFHVPRPSPLSPPPPARSNWLDPLLIPALLLRRASVGLTFEVTSMMEKFLILNRFLLVDVFVLPFRPVLLYSCRPSVESHKVGLSH